MNFSHFPQEAKGGEMGFYNSSMIELDESVKELHEQREGLLIDMGTLERVSLHSLPTHVRLLWSHPGSGIGFEIYEYSLFWDPAPGIAHIECQNSHLYSALRCLCLVLLPALWLNGSPGQRARALRRPGARSPSLKDHGSPLAFDRCLERTASYAYILSSLYGCLP